MIAAVALAAFLVVAQPARAGVHRAHRSTPTPAATSNDTPATTGPEISDRGRRASAPSTTLPAVPDSDATLRDALSALFAGAPLDRIFHLEQIVPRFVATIDNLPRQTVALSRISVKPIGGNLETTQSDGQHPHARRQRDRATSST